MQLRRSRKTTRVEMLPLMDVVFLLLVFFIYSMMFMVVQRGLAVSLPASSTAVSENKAVIALTVTDDGGIYVDKEQVHLEQLTETLNMRIAYHSEENTVDGETGVQIFADENVRYNDLYQVLDAVKLSKIRKISLQARQK